MLLDLLLLAGGLALLLWSADRIIEECEAIAMRFSLSATVVGLTLVAFGTSFPELVISAHAALSGSSGLAVGNVVGSNIANTLLILGVAAILIPIPVTTVTVKRDGTVWLVATLFFLALAYGKQTIGLLPGLVLLTALAVYVVVLLRSGEIDSGSDNDEHRNKSLWLIGALFGIFVVGIAVGSHLTVAGASRLAVTLGVQESVIGVTLVALGTSLPELATTLACVRKKDTGMLVGNIVGSNIFNILAVVGVTATLTTLAIPAHMLTYDLPVMFFVTLLGLLFLRSDWRVTRAEAVICLIGYASYVTWVFASI